VATEKPLSLRRQKGVYQSRRSSSSNKPAKQAEIFVDSGVFHLDETYSYSISEELENEVRSGSVVWVPFNNKKVLGIVRAVGISTRTGLKYVDSVALSSGFSPLKVYLSAM
jgi:primosomal protein N' (replication factor Y) (superfamily II helicase)